MGRDIFERIYSSHWFLSSYNGPGFVFDFPKLGGGNYITKAIYIMEKDMCRYIFDTKEFDAAAHFNANRLINDNKWRAGIYRKIDFYTKRYFEAGEKLRSLPLHDFQDKKIVATVRRVVPLQHYHQVYSILANGVVLDGRNHFSNKIREGLRRNINDERKFEEHWSFLTQVTKMSLRQKKDYEIALLAKGMKKMSNRQIQERLGKLHQKYCWLDYNNMGPAASLEEFQQALQEAIKNNNNLDLLWELKTLKEKQRQLTKKLQLNTQSRFLLNLAQHVIWQKGYRKDMQYHGFYCYEALFKELARRKNISDWQTLTFLFPWEVENFLLRNIPTVSELKERRKYSCFIVKRTGPTMLWGRKARQFVKKLNLVEDFSHLSQAKGQCAYAGKVKGRVKLVQTPKDMQKMQKGNVLLSQATSPDLLPAMKKAAAIVTNTGGLICHAAITSRELKIPCVVGTGNATLIFKDRELVEVDATKGIIRRIG